MIRIKRSKFNVGMSDEDKIKRTFNGIVLDSDKEAEFYQYHLIPLYNKGEISNIIIHPKYVLQEGYVNREGKKILPIYYELDFEYTKNGEQILIDIKGMILSEMKLKKKIFEFKYPDKKLYWLSWSGCDGGWITVEDLKKARAKRKKEKEKRKNGE
jgi:hypothetical protein